MKALVLDAPQQLRVGDWPAPKCGPGDVILRPIAAGICAGDLQHYGGRNPYTNYPLVCGHEVCGTVTEVGSNVSRVKRGDLVVIEPVVGCGHCYPCRHGQPNCCVNFCLIGLHRPGGYADLCLAPEANVHAIPGGLDPVTASFAEPLTIGIHACRRGQVTAGEYCLILGAGPIGLAILEIAKLRGARVTIADINEERLAFARELGADTLKANDMLRPTVLEQTRNEGADVVIEATGDPKAVESTIDLVAPGARVVIVGLVKKGIGVTLPGLDFTRKEVNLFGSRNSVGCFPEAIALLASGAIKYPRVATKIPMWDAVPVFAKLHENPVALHKAVLILPIPRPPSLPHDMKFVSFQPKSRPEAHIGALVGEQVIDLNAADASLPATMPAFVALGAAALEAAAHAIASAEDASERWRLAGIPSRVKPVWPLEEVTLLAPIPRPGKILCSGLNYRSHVEENPHAKFLEDPRFFAKLPNTVIGPGEAIRHPGEKYQVDYEVELAVIIGGPIPRGTPAKRVMEHVFGYTILHDVSARYIQFKDNNEMMGKNFDTFCPLGPHLVTADEIPDPSKLRLRTLLNGRVMQDGTNEDWCFPLPRLLAWLSSAMTLEPGDVVSTGTPAGIGWFRKPQVFLKVGDVCRLEIEAIGALENPVVRGETEDC